MIIQSLNKKVGFYFAKAYFQIGTKEENKSNKMNYLIKGIKSYNKYLLRNLGVQFDARQIYSKVVCDPTIDENEAINTLLKSFNDDQDKLAPIKSMSKIAYIENSETLLVEESVIQKLKNLGGPFAPIAAIIGAIIAAWQAFAKLQ